MRIYKRIFRGGVRIGLWSNSWPNGILEITQDSLVLRDLMLGKEFGFGKKDVDHIEIKKIFPIFGFGIKIVHSNKEYNPKVYFWFVGFNFNKLIEALKYFNWIR